MQVAVFSDQDNPSIRHGPAIVGDVLEILVGFIRDHDGPYAGITINY